jgi:hydroxymethylglutaryl-CoA lyase|tara:strand:+ start:1136 stop:1990 length:855 start_codon:yes stop_codon:yes gene_type:complete
MSEVKIIECPRDAMQGIHEFIPTAQKVEYLNQLLKVGFDTIDFGSFVSPKAIPQLKDTSQVLSKLDLSTTKSKLLAIVANERGAEDACKFDEIDFLGYPFSISETFQQRNTNSTIEQSLGRIEAIQELCAKNNKELVTYMSMGFGNPYGDPFHEDIVASWIEKLVNFDLKIFALSDTIGVSEPQVISRLFSTLIKEYPNLEIGAHLHTRPDSWKEKVEAAFKNGCRRFDGALLGYGGCPMAADDLTGNMATENLVSYFKEESVDLGLNNELFEKAREQASKVFL